MSLTGNLERKRLDVEMRGGNQRGGHQRGGKENEGDRK